MMPRKKMLVPKFLAPIAKRIRDIEVATHKGLVIDTPEVFAERLADGRIMLRSGASGGGGMFGGGGGGGATTAEATYVWNSEIPPGTGNHRILFADRPGTIVNIHAEGDAADGEATAEFDVKLNGTSIFPTSPKPTLDAGDELGPDVTPDTTAFVLHDEIRVNVLDTGGRLGRLLVAIKFTYDL